MRHDRGIDLDEAIYSFYAQRLEDVSSVHNLNRLVRKKQRENPDFLLMREADLVGDTGRGLRPACLPRSPGFVPLPETAHEIAIRFRPTHGSTLASLEAFILDRYGVQIQRSDWTDELALRTGTQT